MYDGKSELETLIGLCAPIQWRHIINTVPGNYSLFDGTMPLPQPIVADPGKHTW